MDVKPRLAPGGGGGGAWLGGPRTASSDNYTATPAGLLHGELPNYDGAERQATGTSIFDPVLCELAYKWFCPPSGVVLDPFAGGSVRGIVAATLGYAYTGFELRPEQTAANRIQAARICPDNAPTWVDGDSLLNIPAWQGEADFVFSCPPYGNLEVYSDRPDDLSAMTPEGFGNAYAAIIAAAVAKLRPNRFACFVVGDYRCKKGFYNNFVGQTVTAFERAGARFYNEAILVTAVGSLPIRVGQQFRAARKLGKTHQNVLVFCKGDPRKATEALA
jgi:DNA modification methylase